MFKRKRGWLIGAAVALMWMLGAGARPAHAYIDPGTGSSLIPALGPLLLMFSAVIAVGLTKAKRIGGWCLAKVGLRRRTAQTQDHDA